MNINLYFAGFFAIFCYAALAPLAKKFLPTIPSFAFMALSMLVLATIAGVMSALYEKDFSLSRLSAASWIGLLAFGAINFVGFAVYLYTIERMPIAHYQLLALMTPIIGGILAYFVLKEPFKPQYLAGLVLVSGGIFIAVRDWGA